MDFKIKKMTVKDSREIKKRFEDCIKLTEKKGLQVGSVLNMEMQDRLKEINLKVKKETAEQYKKLFNYTEFAAETLGINFNNEQIVDNNSVMNDHCYDRFLQAFRTLLEYFKSI